jgi:hypothetical protein
MPTLSTPGSMPAANRFRPQRSGWWGHGPWKVITPQGSAAALRFVDAARGSLVLLGMTSPVSQNLEDLFELLILITYRYSAIKFLP